MKGVILSINPAARILDLSHAHPRRRTFATPTTSSAPRCRTSRRARSTSASSIRASAPSGAAIFVEAGGQRLRRPGQRRLHRRVPQARRAAVVRRLTERRFWRPTVSRHVPRPRHLRPGRGPPEPRHRPGRTRPGTSRTRCELPTRSAVTFGKQLAGRGSVRRRLREPHHQHPGVQAEVAAGEGVGRRFDRRTRCAGCGRTPRPRRGNWCACSAATGSSRSPR